MLGHWDPPLREFLHADDLGEACVFALEHWSALNEDAPLDDDGNPLAFLNVGTGVDLSIRELANAYPLPWDSRAQFTGTTANRMAPQETT